MAKPRRPLRAFYLLYVSRGTYSQRSHIGLLGPVDARTKREAMQGLIQMTQDNPIKSKCLFVDITGLPPLFISDYERAGFVEDTLTYLHAPDVQAHRLCGARSRFSELFFCPKTNRVHLGVIHDRAIYTPGAGLIKTVDLKAAKLATLSETPTDTMSTPKLCIFHLTNDHIISAA